jgi:hypothetical protein
MQKKVVRNQPVGRRDKGIACGHMAFPEVTQLLKELQDHSLQSAREVALNANPFRRAADASTDTCILPADEEERRHV